MAGRREGRPGNVEPTGAGEQLVALRVVLQEVYQLLKLGWVARTDVGGLPEQVLRVFHATNQSVHTAVAETGVDDDGPYHLAGRLQYHEAAISHVRHILHRGDILRVLAQVEEFGQTEMLRQFYVI